MSSILALWAEGISEIQAFFEENPRIESTLSAYIGEESAHEAIAIAAPEVGFSSIIADMVETYSLKVFYAQFGQGDFSIGCFQMKPKFAEQIERIIHDNTEWRKKYADLIIAEETAQAERAERVRRLSALKYQSLYLAAFYDIASARIVGWTSNAESAEQRLRNLATLYNGGLNLTEEEVLALQGKQQFPAYSFEQYNYSDLVIEYYNYVYGVYDE